MVDLETLAFLASSSCVRKALLLSSRRVGMASSYTLGVRLDSRSHRNLLLELGAAQEPTPLLGVTERLVEGPYQLVPALESASFDRMKGFSTLADGEDESVMLTQGFRESPARPPSVYYKADLSRWALFGGQGHKRSKP